MSGDDLESMPRNHIDFRWFLLYKIDTENCELVACYGLTMQYIIWLKSQLELLFTAILLLLMLDVQS